MAGAEGAPTDPERVEPVAVADTRNQEIVGLVALVVGWTLLAAALDGWGAWPTGAPSALLVLYWFAVANLIAAGFFVLLSGLEGHALTSDRRALRGLLVKLVGTNIVLPALGLLFYVESSRSGEEYDQPWLIVGGYALYLLTARASLMWIRRGWKYQALSADALLAADSRAPVLYLRSFVDDDDPSGERSLAVRAWRNVRWHTHVFTIEQELTRVLSRVGPVVAIGRPGESLPELGAARLYARDDEWRATVSELMPRARLVVIRAGPTPGLQWEIEEAYRLLPSERVVLVAPPQRPPKGSHLLHVLPPSRALDAVLDRFSGSWAVAPAVEPVGEIVLFDHTPHRHVVPIVPSVRWRSLWLSLWRPYLECVESAFRQAFDRLELPWIEPKSRATAGLLALFGGIVGLHQFYLGNRRRGLWYLAFCWTGVPMILGWIDLIRLVLAGNARFREHFPMVAPAMT